MKTILRDSFEEFEILQKQDVILPFNDVSAAASFLRRFLSDRTQMENLRSYAEKSIGPVAKMSDHEIIDQIARRVANGDIQFLKRANGTSARRSRLPEQSEAAEGAIPPAQQAEEKKKTAWIEIKLVDMNGDPVAGEKYKLELPDGSTKEGSLDDQGMARETGIDPGSAKVSFPDLDKDAWEGI